MIERSPHELDYLNHEVWWHCMCGEEGGPFDSELAAEVAHAKHEDAHAEPEETTDGRR